MLTVEKFPRRTQQEAAMSSFRLISSAAGQEGRLVRHEAKTSTPAHTEKTRSPQPDQEMMYAWSIGVTSAVRTLTQARRDQEACPPEVYIG
jgi:hypothetical protein